ncbi:FkbM family methyltransferase [Massilia sp. METH4]|uniref:FkbM family methyltransferase n=1 Tax=Massilia sp. METH4 TaxID=3123041 RepID=UPI0030CD1A2D
MSKHPQFASPAAAADAFLAPGQAVGRYLLGRNEHAAALLDIPAIAALVDGIIDDRATEPAWRGKPVLRGEQVAAPALAVNCSMSISPVSAARRLAALGFAPLHYADLLEARPDLVPAPPFVAEMRADLAAHANEWAALAERLADDASRAVLRDLVAYRGSAHPRHMAGYTVRFDEQYFEPFMPLHGETFVDAGGFDGDTTEQFCRRDPAYRGVILFEPSGANIARARERLAGRPNIRFEEMGVSDAPGTLSFDPHAGSASAVSSSGTVSIAVTTIDEAVSEPVSFIKMDLEGWEMRALAGAARHIRADHPKLAIAVYHSAADFRHIPAYILGLRDDYAVYLRHYSEGWSETVMFFVPRTRRDTLQDQ